MSSLSTRRAFNSNVLAGIEDRLAESDAALANLYPGDDGRRQPIQTTYVAADKFTPNLTFDWGQQALDTAERAGGLAAVAVDARVVSGHDAAERADALAALVENKLRTEPIEDLRLDFEDGYGPRPDDVEDTDVVAAAGHVVAAVRDEKAPPFIGIRFKCLERPTRARGLRTLDLFIAELCSAAALPDGLVLTLPKVTSVAQVEAMVAAAQALESAHGLPAGRIRFEIQVETPQLILGADGRAPVAQAIHAGAGRVSSLHYGTYDYSASLGIAAAYQSMEHPVADHAKNVMQLAIAGTGVHMSDGSTNILPVGDADNVSMAWRLHARLVRRHLERGIYQGWDLHPAQLVTRYLATYGFYRDGFTGAATRLRNYVQQLDSTVMDEPATARALALFIHRGVVCGALTADEVAQHAGLSVEELRSIALNR